MARHVQGGMTLESLNSSDGVAYAFVVVVVVSNIVELTPYQDTLSSFLLWMHAIELGRVKYT